MYKEWTLVDKPGTQKRKLSEIAGNNKGYIPNKKQVCVCAKL